MTVPSWLDRKLLQSAFLLPHPSTTHPSDEDLSPGWVVDGWGTRPFGLFLAGWCRFDIAFSPTFTAKKGKKQPQILHCVQDDKRWTQRDLKCDCPDASPPIDHPPQRRRLVAGGPGPLDGWGTRHPVYFWQDGAGSTSRFLQPSPQRRGKNNRRSFTAFRMTNVGRREI